MDGLGGRNLEKPVINLPILNQDGIVAVLQRHNVYNANSSGPLMFDKPNTESLVIAIDDVLGDDGKGSTKPPLLDVDTTAGLVLVRTEEMHQQQFGAGKLSIPPCQHCSPD
jgi:hypothetical protein